MAICDYSAQEAQACAHCARAAVEDPLVFTSMLAEELLQQHNLAARGWHFELEPGLDAVAQCRYGASVIVVSLWWAKHLPRPIMREVLLHEIAHALSGNGTGHGTAWRAVARRIGCSGEQYLNKYLAAQRPRAVKP